MAPIGMLTYVLVSSIVAEPAFLGMLLFVSGIIFPFFIGYIQIFEAFLFYSLKTKIICSVFYFLGLLVMCKLVSMGRYLPTKLLEKSDLMKGKTVAITGCTRGIGLETVKQLVRWGVSELVLCYRNKEMIEDIKQKLVNIGMPLNKIHTVECDLTSFPSIEQCSKEILLKIEKVDILINNAGIMACPFKLIDGIELQFMSNHLGHFYLTKKLLPLLLKSKTRVINVSSISHLFVPYGFEISELDNINEVNYSRARFYSISKLCNIYFTRELQKRYGSMGITSVALHQGCVDTDLGRYISEESILFNLSYPLMKLFSKTPFSGAQTTLYCCAISNEVLIPGGYYSQCSLDMSSPISLDMNISEKIWDYSESLCEKFNK